MRPTLPEFWHPFTGYEMSRLTGLTLYLTGVTNSKVERLVNSLQHYGTVGLLVQPASGYQGRLANWGAWAADNGCFSQGERFQPGAWLRWLDALPRERCLFAVAPDVVGDHEATLQRSLPFLDRIRDMGFPAAFVAQNGCERDIPGMPWERFDVLFLGGDTEWKLSEHACLVTSYAKLQGKRVHMGRVNSEERLALANSWGVDSADGTYLKFGLDQNLPRLLSWPDGLDRRGHGNCWVWNEAEGRMAHLSEEDRPEWLFPELPAGPGMAALALAGHPVEGTRAHGAAL